MSTPRRFTLLAGVILLLLAAAAAWSIDDLFRQQDRAQDAAADLRSCGVLALQIQELRARPALASTKEMDVQELGQRIDAASGQAALAPGSLEGVFPQPAQRVGDSPYLLKPTAISLRNVTLPQLATFLQQLTAGSRLTVRDLRLRAPLGGADAAWDAEATVAALIHAPITPRRRAQ